MLLFPRARLSPVPGGGYLPGGLRPPTLRADECAPDEPLTSRFGLDPRPVLPWRVVADMLRMPAGKIGDPDAVGVRVETEDAARVSFGSFRGVGFVPQSKLW